MSSVQNNFNNLSTSLSKAESATFCETRKPAPLTMIVDLDERKYLTKEPTHPYSGPTSSSHRDWILLRSQWDDPKYIPRLGPT